MPISLGDGQTPVTLDEWLLDMLPAAVYVCDCHGVLRYFNRRAVEQWGWEPALGDTDQRFCGAIRLYYPDGRPMAHARTPMAEALHTGLAQRDREAIIERPDGSRSTVLVNVAPLQDERGLIVGAVNVFQDISGRKQAEEARGQLAAIVESSDDAIIGKTLDGVITSWNAGAERLYGYSAGEVVGRPIALLLPPDRADDLPGLLERLRRVERIDHYETTRRRKDGQLLDVSVTISPIKDAEGRVIGASAISRDVTGRKRAERRRAARLAVTQILAQADSVREAAPRILQAVGESLEWSVGALWTVDHDAGVLRCLDVWHLPGARAQRFAETTRQTAFGSNDSLPGRVWSSGRPLWLPDVVQDERFQRRHVAADDGLHGGFACPIFLNDNVLGVIEFFSPDIREPDADLLEMMTTLGGQIGQLIERKRAEGALRESEQRFARFMQHLPGLAWIKDLRGRYVYANDAAENAFRTPRAVLYGKTDEEVFPPETAARFRDNDARALASGTGVQVVEALEHADGTLHHSIVSKFPILAPDGTPALIGGMAIDITDRLKAEEALREADRRKDEFLAMLAHELRNPLAPIRNALHIMKLSGADAVILGQVRDMAERQVRHMARLLDDLLDVSRISRGRIELRREAVDVAAVVTRTVEAARPLLEERRHRLGVALPPGPLRVEADPARLEQVLTNLLNNAAKYTDPGGHVWISAGREGGEVVIRVKDSGIGIAADVLPRVFDLFVQAERRLDRAQGGVGIGLTLVKRLVELHGGTVNAHSDGPGQGSEFVVRLPTGTD